MLILSCVCMKLIQNQFVKYYKPIVGETWGDRIRQKTIQLSVFRHFFLG